MNKNIILTIIGLFAISLANAQTAYNPFTQNIHFAPEPTIQGFECGTTQHVEFTQGLTTIDDATQWQTNPLTVIICLTGFTFEGPASSVVSGTYASNFDWAFDDFAPNCIVGTQKQTLAGTGTDPFSPNPAASGNIKLQIKVPETSPIDGMLAVNVNLQVPGYMSQFNSTPDDNEATQTQTFCALKISGNVFYDVTLLNNKIDGTPIHNPANEQLYANLIGSNGNVLAVVPVGTDGKYQFGSIAENTNYQIVLSTIQGVVGSPAPVAQVPVTWQTVGESCCNDITAQDGNNNGIINVSILKASKINANFGIYTLPTPVKLTYFYATENNCAGLLTWSTASESNTSHVEIMRSEDATNYRKIATVQSAGNSQTSKVYTYLDQENIAANSNYSYRLRFVDLDGKDSYSDVRTITFNCNNENNTSVNIFPNPATTNLNVLYVTEKGGEMLDVKIVDITGRTIQSQLITLESGSNLVEFNTEALAAGSYFIKYKNDEAITEGTIKFQKK